MIDRQLRPIGAAIRFVWPSFSERKFKFCNFILKKLRARRGRYAVEDKVRADKDSPRGRE